jgi:hypothetical protein
MENQFEFKRYLSENEIADPIAVIHDLYINLTDIEYLKSDLWEWVKAALQDQPLTYLSEPGLAIQTEKMLIRLFAALHLLAKKHQFHLPEQISIDEEEKHEKDFQKFSGLYELFYLHRGHVRRLNPDEVTNPYLAIHSFFSFHSLEEWQRVLNQWSEYALTKSSIIESDEGYSILQEYEQIEKMIEVAYLLNKEPDKFNERYHASYWKGLEITLRPRPDRDISLKFIKASIRFLDIVPPTRFNQNVRGMLIDFLHYNKGCIPFYFENLLLDLEYFFDFMDACAKETKHWEREEERDEV